MKALIYESVSFNLLNSLSDYAAAQVRVLCEPTTTGLIKNG